MPDVSELSYFAKTIAELERAKCVERLLEAASKIPKEQRQGYVYKTVIQCAKIIRASVKE